jgi:UDP-N-acetylglucosamine diphosphorylase / glucose-1-phosphate thymidylyltransferase / UDP-N-acetylgalactosamine diphosphorylase / glucosamine-1-phosphate N-acetyltransferase / galactosamine-1-phosphate N-acetyltransferase
MLTLADLTDLQALPEAWRSLADARRPWDVLERLDALLAEIEPLDAGEVHPSAVVEGTVRLEAGSRIGPHAFVQGPAWLMAGAEVGHAAFVRGGVLMGEGAKVGHASEVKRSVLLAHAKVPHFNYVGDSFVGRHVNLGAGVKCANLKATGGDVTIDGAATGLRKLGALLGDGVSIGCNAVLAPGTVIGAGSVVYQSASVRGVVPPRTLVKVRMATELVALRER